ncbi:MAG: hypothetical protein IJR86_07370 [Bacteroidaceae bacterium]|nr:hypothetical protein [Bacteroidaceae bacterium]
MKKVNLLFTALLLFVAGIAFSSCEDEKNNGVTLSGQWDSDVFFAEYSVENPETPGTKVKCLAKHTRLCFDSGNNSFAQQGTGKQIDYYDYGPYVQVYRTFKWVINKHVHPVTVTINYDEESIPTYNGKPIYEGNDNMVNFYAPGINSENFTGFYNDSQLSADYNFAFTYDSDFHWDLEYESQERGDNWYETYKKYMEENNYDFHTTD